jgi:DNA polymerase elongation subunit (family B)
VKTVVFDIETVGLPWLELDPLQREAMTRGTSDGEEYRKKKDWRSLSPYAAKAVVIAMLNPDTGQGKIWYEEEGGRSCVKSEDGLFERIGLSEKEMLEEFWDTLSRFDRVVSYNGRSFDGPFLSVRSAICGVAPTKNLSGYRYSMAEHVDLLEVLTFNGATDWKSRPSLHAACVAFGIPSPKSAEMHGYAVGDAYREGRLAEIADYCRRDVEATAALYRKVETTLLPFFLKR